VIAMKSEGLAPRAMRMRIDGTYADLIDASTPTPYPTA
jgi:hypothetical protein